MPMSSTPRRERIASATRPPTGTHSITREIQKCSRKPRSTWCRCSQLFSFGWWIRCKSSDALASRSGEGEQGAPALDDQEEGGRDEEDRVRRFDRDRVARGEARECPGLPARRVE